MKKFTGTFASLAVITALATPAFAQTPTTSAPQAPTTQTQPEQQSPSTVRPQDQAPQIDMSTRDDKAVDHNMVTGELVKVDSDLMEITIKSADDQQHTFRYADSTKVDGADEQVSGLATKQGQLVTVYFTQGAGDSRIATKVKFDKKK
jgi:hypothetical protein